MTLFFQFQIPLLLICSIRLVSFIKSKTLFLRREDIYRIIFPQKCHLSNKITHAR